MSQNYQNPQNQICMTGVSQPLATGKQPVGVLSNINLKFCSF